MMGIGALIRQIAKVIFTNLGWEKIDETVYNNARGVIMRFVMPC